MKVIIDIRKATSQSLIYQVAHYKNVSKLLILATVVVYLFQVFCVSKTLFNAAKKTVKFLSKIIVL